MSNPGLTEALRTDPTAPDADSTESTQYRVGDPAPPPLTAFTEAELIEMWGGRTEPVVSILCPTYNHRDFITKTLDGFLGQRTSFPFEVIVRDDASTDGTTEIVREYARRYPTVVRPIIEPENTFSRGEHFLPPLGRAVRGAFVATCGGDDYWIDPLKLADQLDLLKQHPGVALVSTGFVPITRDRVIKSEDFGTGGTVPVRFRRRMTFVSTWLFRRSDADLASDIYHQIIGEDLLILSQLAVAGDTLHLPGRPTAVRHIHENSIWIGAANRDRNFRTFHMINGTLWISEYHRRHGHAAADRYCMRRSVAMWLCFLESISANAPWRFSIYAIAWCIKHKLLPRRRH